MTSFPRAADAVDVRLVFRLYTAFTWVLAALMPLSHLLFHAPAEEWPLTLRLVAGTVALGCVGVPLARAHDALVGRAALQWMGLGFCLLSVSLYPTADGSLAVRMTAVGAACVGLTFFYLWTTVDGEPSVWSRSLSITAVRPVALVATAPADEAFRQAIAQEERHRLARDLHDSVKQDVFAINVTAATALTQAERGGSGHAHALHEIGAAARRALATLDGMLGSLSAQPIGTHGLVDAVRQQCELLRLRTGADVVCTLDGLPPDARFVAGSHDALFRIAQEALANIARHARASKVSVRLSADEERLTLHITDNGQGRAAAALSTRSTGMGISNMKARAAELGGGVTVADASGHGTVVTALLPLIPQARANAHEDRSRALWTGFACLALCATALHGAAQDGIEALVPYLPPLCVMTIMMSRAVRAWRVSRETQP